MSGGKFISFVGGLVVGALVGGYFVYNKVRDEADEEVDEIKKMYDSRLQSAGDIIDDMIKDERERNEAEIKGNEKPVIFKGGRKMKEETDYTQYNKEEEKKDIPKKEHKAFYMISQEEFDSSEGYEAQEIVCNNEHFIDSATNDIVDDIFEEEMEPSMIEMINKLPEGTNVYIRYDTLKLDYHIIKE